MRIIVGLDRPTRPVGARPADLGMMGTITPEPHESSEEALPQDRNRSPAGQWIVRISIALYVAVGVFPYLVSGLLVPPLAVATLLACWAIGLVVTLRFARRRPIIAPAAVAAAIAFWFAFVSVGSAVFGWTA